MPLQPNRQQLLGKEFSPVPPYEVTGTYYFIPLQAYGAMPVNHTNPRGPNGKYASGKGWNMWKAEYDIGSGEYNTYRGDHLSYSGRYYADSDLIQNTPPAGWDTAPGLQQAEADLSALGAEAWGAMRPDKPDFDLALNILEMKDPLRSLQNSVKDIRRKIAEASRRDAKGAISNPKTRLNQRGTTKNSPGRASASPSGKARTPAQAISKTAEWHLAVSFGWLPILRAIGDYASAHNSKQKRLEQLMRDEGRPIRRRYDFKRLTFENSTQFSETFPYPYNPYLEPTHVTYCYPWWMSSYTVTKHVTSKKTWAEGQFRYLLPPGPRTVLWKKKLLNRIMGGKITPSTLYNLVPWSFLVDYFVDLGKVVKNYSDGVGETLICDYAFIMQTNTWVTTTTATGFTYGVQGSINQVEAHRISRYVQKLRTAASPFGFGFRQGDLSAKQIGILGALGYSRLP